MGESGGLGVVHGRFLDAAREPGQVSGGAVSPAAKVHRGVTVGPDSRVLDNCVVGEGCTLVSSTVAGRADIRFATVENSTVEGWARVFTYEKKQSELKSSRLDGYGQVFGGCRVDSSTVTGLAILSAVDVDNSHISGEAKLVGGWRRGPVSHSTVSGGANVYWGAVSHSTVSGGAVVEGGSVSHSTVSGGAVVKESDVSDCQLSGTVELDGTRIVGCALAEGYFVGGDIRGPGDVQVARDGGYTYFRYRRRSRFPWRRWAVTRQVVRGGSGEVVNEVALNTLPHVEGGEHGRVWEGGAFRPPRGLRWGPPGG